MKAVIINRYGSEQVLEYADIEQPQIRSNQLLVKVGATSVNPIDWKIRNGLIKLLTGNKFPLLLGFDVAGEVLEVGDRVTHFQKGDLIYARLDSLPGGAYAEYAAVSESAACLKPSNMSDEQAAAVPLAAMTALQALRDAGNLQSGDRVLINGASGGVGIFAVQVAKAMQAEVTAVCSSKNVELVKNLGADSVIDYTQTDFTQNPPEYDIIFDVVGNQSFFKCQKCLKPNGIYVTTQPTPDSFLSSFLTLLLPGKKAKVIVVKSSGKDLADLKELIEADKIRSIIDRTYPLSEAAAAQSQSEQGHAVGKIVMTVP